VASAFCPAVICFGQVLWPEAARQAAKENQPGASFDGTPGRKRNAAAKNSPSASQCLQRFPRRTDAGCPSTARLARALHWVENALYRVWNFPIAARISKEWQLRIDKAFNREDVDWYTRRPRLRPALALRDGFSMIRNRNPGNTDSIGFKRCQFLEAPADLIFKWSDGHLQVTPRNLTSTIPTRRERSRLPGPTTETSHGRLGWLAARRFNGFTNPSRWRRFHSTARAESLTTLPNKKLDGRENWATCASGKESPALRTAYRTAAFLLRAGPTPLQPRYGRCPQHQVDGQDQSEPVPEISHCYLAQNLTTARLRWPQGLRRFEGHASPSIRVQFGIWIHRRPVVSWPEMSTCTTTFRTTGLGHCLGCSPWSLIWCFHSCGQPHA